MLGAVEGPGMGGFLSGAVRDGGPGVADVDAMWTLKIQER